MAVKYDASRQFIVGPAADKAGALDAAAVGAEYFEDDTGLTYRKSVAGAWILAKGASGSINAGPADRTPAHTAPSATSVTGALLAANSSRKAALLINIGSVDVFINLGAAAVASTGILLQANGGSFSMSDMLGNLDNAVINGITASGSATVLVTEWT